MAGWQLIIHGGSGSMRRGVLPPADEAAATAGLEAALAAGAAILDGGGAALDAVAAAVRVLEDDPAFNAGRGSVFTWEGAISLDAAIMDGATRAAGAISGTSRARNPIDLARAVMTDGRHVLLSGADADAFGETQAIAPVAPGWFEIAERRRQLDEIKAGGGFDSAMKYGTVGAVARDAAGNLAAATSTGGLTAKRWGRIGDSPLIGAGTYADRNCAVSCTGHGEAFIRAVAAHSVAMRVGLAGEDVIHAARAVLGDVEALGGRGGMIVLGGDNGGWAFTTPGMYRGMARAGSPPRVAIYEED